MKKLLFPLVANILILAPVAKADSKTPSEYWKDANLPYSLIEETISNKHCYSNEVTFYGCYQALNQMIGIISPNQSLSAINLQKPMIKDFGPLKVVENPPADEKKSVVEYFTELKQEREETKAQLHRLFQQGPKPDFDAMIAWEKSLIPTDRISETVAAAYNNFLANTVDPHTYIIPADELNHDQEESSSSFVGIGAEIGVIHKDPIIRNPLEGSPALEAGIRANDLIEEVDGKNVHGMDMNDLVKLIRGPKGSQVRLKIKRGTEELTITISRREIIQENVTSKVLREDRHSLGYIRLVGFSSEASCDDIESALKELQANKVQGLVLDLRNNGGGLLKEAVCIAGLFLPRESRVVEQRFLDTGRPSQWGITTEEPVEPNLPLIVLLNSRSASASELLAGALQDNDRAYVVGVRSFGKGSVQNIGRWDKSPKVYQAKTIARFYQPSGRTNQVSGILPDFPEVFTKPNPSDEDKFALREEDLFPNALPPVGPPYTPRHPEKIAQIQNCVEKTGIAVSRYSQHESDSIAPDYQLLTAEDTLSCMLQ